jgi:DNA (cytosine-5)-methyltransferase 3A
MIVLSLFDGISTGRLALKNAGIEVEAYYSSEIDESAIKISEKNWSDIIRLGDVTKIDIEALPKIDLVIGGSPCQGFSRNGKCLNFEDPRSKLFFVFSEILEKVKAKNPDVKFLLENVIMKKEWRDVISDVLGVQPIEINSKLMSAQSRPRQYWTNIEGIELPEDKGVRLIDILEDVPLEIIERNGVKFATNTGKGISKRQMDIAHLVGGEVRISQATKDGYIVAEPGDGVNLQFPTSKTKRGRVIKGKSPTLDTGCRVCVYTGEVIREYTLTELERLQTLPDGYTNAEGISESSRRKAIGNGWTTDVITHIFSFIKEKQGATP